MEKRQSRRQCVYGGDVGGYGGDNIDGTKARAARVKMTGGADGSRS